jgi:nucleoside 2-deoxyribosyltransferase
MSQEELNYEGLSVFLAGPTPRIPNLTGWREMAIEGFTNAGFNGTLIVPEFRGEKTLFDYKRDSINFEYSKQIEWELEAMEKADIILFHINRKISVMPGFTTNIEFGYWIAKDKSKIVLSTPKKSEKMDYIKYIANKYSVPTYEMFMDAVYYIKERE